MALEQQIQGGNRKDVRTITFNPNWLIRFWSSLNAPTSSSALFSNSSAWSYPYDPTLPKSLGWINTLTVRGSGPSGVALNRTDGRTSECRVEMKSLSCLIIVQLAWWQWAFPPLVSRFNLLSQPEIQAAALYHLLLEPRWQPGARPARGEKTISK